MSSPGAELPFVRTLNSLVAPTDEPDLLTADELAEVNRRCDEIAWARARAEVSSRDYIIRS